MAVRGRPRRCFPVECVWWGAPYDLHAETDVARVLLHDDAAPRDALVAAVHARARLGVTMDEGAAEASAPAVADAG